MVEANRVCLDLWRPSTDADDTPVATYLSNRERHSMLWDTFFSNYKWLNEVEKELKVNPVLIGTRLDGSKPAYMALISGDTSGDVIYTKDLFLGSLKSHKYVEGTGEIIFEGGIILNVADILDCPELIPVDIQKLLYDGDIFRSTYSFWKDIDSAPRVIERPFLTLTKSRIQGDDECFWIIHLESQSSFFKLEISLKDSTKDTAMDDISPI